MPGLFSNPILLGIAAATLSIACTLAVRLVAVKYNFVAKPKSDRWHKRPTAMLGGVAIFLATALTYFLFVPATRQSLVVFGGATFLFGVGLIDDLLNIRPYQKLIGQLIGAGTLVLSGLKLPLTGFEIIDIWLTVFWVIGITNAINLLDNMDGLAAGISAIASVSLALNFWVNGLTNELLLTSALIGALIGFLVFNFNPASIFMGDCGSMFVGFLLSGTVLLNQVGGRSRGILAILAVPVLILFVPIFDTTFVTVLRKLWGRKASQGGRDHTSHRLVALGLSERSAVLMLYAFAVFAGVLAILVGHIGPASSFALIGLFIAGLVIVGVYLSKVKVYEGEDEQRAAEGSAVFAFLVNVSHKRRIFEVFLDAFLVTLAYYSAFALFVGSFDGQGAFEGSSNWELFLKTLPLMILIKLGAFLAVGVYRGLWRYTSVGDMITIAKGVFLGSALSILAVLLVYRFEGFSRTVFFLDGILLLLGVVGSRMAFRVIRQILPLPVAGDGRRVLIYGAGDGGEMVLRELNNNPVWNLRCVGFIDDDPLKTDKLIHGLKVFSGNGMIDDICREKDVAEILISTRNLRSEQLKRMREMCADNNIVLKRAQMKIEPVDLV
jgi:UDP-GlcNAc:undecaprenyl-phosphate/decaprenyl-phosphate GlcNAc-1-phosphate transferase